jgi:hypothetical protein
MIADIRDRAADGFPALGCDVVIIRFQGLRECQQVGMEEECAVVEEVVTADVLRAAGDLAAGNEQVVAVVDFNSDTHLFQGCDHRVGHTLDVPAHGVGLDDDGVVEIAEVVIDGATAGDPAGDVDVMLCSKGEVDFLDGVLVFSDDDSVLVLPEEEAGFGFLVLAEEVFFRGEVEIDVV